MNRNKRYSYSDFISIFERARERVQAFDDIPDDLFTLKPDRKSWSAAEICSHIAKFNRIYIGSIQKAASLEPVYAENAERTFRPGFFYGLYASALEPPYSLKLKTLQPFYPAKVELEKESVIEQLLDSERTVSGLIQEFSEKNLDLSRSMYKNPIIKFLPMSVTDFLVLMDAHQRRHVWQLEQTLLRLSGNTYEPAA